MSLKAPMSAVPDRSEIGPYLGSSSGHSRESSKKTTSPMHLRGGAISPKAPRLRAWNATDTDQRKDGPPQAWNASEQDMSTAPDRSEIGPYLGGLRAAL